MATSKAEELSIGAELVGAVNALALLPEATACLCRSNRVPTALPAKLIRAGVAALSHRGGKQVKTLVLCNQEQRWISESRSNQPL